MNSDILKNSYKTEKIVRVYYEPTMLTELTVDLIWKELGIDTCVSYDEGPNYVDYFDIVIYKEDLLEPNVKQIEDYFSCNIDSHYEMTLAIVNKLFSSCVNNIYKYGTEPNASVIVEFTIDNYNKLVDNNNEEQKKE